MAKAIVARGGDYVLAVKENQSELVRDARAAIAAAECLGTQSATTRDARPGRKEVRTALVTAAAEMAKTHDFPASKRWHALAASAARARPSSAISC